MDDKEYVTQVVNGWIKLHPYMKNIVDLTQNRILDKDPSKIIQDFLLFSLTAVESNINEIKGKIGSLVDVMDKIKKMHSYYYFKKDLLKIFHEMKFLKLLKIDQEIRMDTNMIELIDHLKNDFYSLYYFARVNEEIIPYLTFDERIVHSIVKTFTENETISRYQSDQIALHFVSSHINILEAQVQNLIEKQLSIMNYYYPQKNYVEASKVTSSSHGATEYNSSNLKDSNIQQTPETNENILSIDEEIEFIINNRNLQFYQDAFYIVNSFETLKPQLFIELSESLAQKIHASLKNQVDIKTCYSYLIDILFALIYERKYRLMKMSTPSYFMPHFLESKTCELGLPPSLIDFSKPLMTVSELVSQDSYLSQAASCLFSTMFMYSPIQILNRIDESLEFIKMYMSEMMKNSGVNPGFVPFDDTFLLFTAVLSASNVCLIQSVATLSCDYIREKMLPNNLAYAQMMLKSAMEYQQRETK